MKALFQVEAIGLTPQQDRSARRLGLFREMSRWHRPWLAELYGMSGNHFLRRYLKPRHDYTDANSRGSRGVWACWTLESGPVYETRYRVTWESWRHQFLIVTAQGEVREVTEQEVRGWLRNVTSGSTS